MRRFQFSVALLLVGALCNGAIPERAAAATTATGWQRPVEGRVVRPFAPPLLRFGPGHLGVDLAAEPDTPVRAAGSGFVAFSGPVAGAVHVVVAHPGGLRTSYSFLARAAVRRGDAVERGDVVGASGGTGEGHEKDVLHVGLRVGDRYVDPMLLWRAVDLVAVVHLAPAELPYLGSARGERRGLLAGLGDIAGSALDAGSSAVAALRTGGAALVGVASAFADPFMSALAAGVRLLPDFVGVLEALPPVRVGAMLVDVGRELLRWFDTLDECDRHAPAADGTGGSGHHLMLVAGINSHAPRGANPMPRLRAERLGYAAGEVSSFSYATDGGAYGASDTHVAIEDAAANLAEQLRARQRAAPGRQVDLLAHSQGGVVVLAFLTLLYDPSDPSYPPLGTVVTLSSPLEGAPLATAARLTASTPAGSAVLDAAASVGRMAGASVPAADGPSVRDLAEGSDVLGRAHEAGLPEQIEFTTIGAAADWIVPASNLSVGGATEVVVNPLSFTAHSDVVGDPEAMRAVRSALEGRSPPCQPWHTALAAAVAPVVISRVEHGLGEAGWLLGAAGTPSGGPRPGR